MLHKLKEVLTDTIPLFKMNAIRCHIFLVFLVTAHDAMMTTGHIPQFFGINSAESAPEFEIVYLEATTRNYGARVVRMEAIASDQVTIDVSAFGEEFHLRIQQDSSFIVDGLEVEYVGVHSDSPMGQEAVRTDCYYRGTLLGDGESVVSVSACNGIIAFIRRASETFYIEPLDDEDVREIEISSYSHLGAPHVMYKGKNRGDMRWACDVIDDEIDYLVVDHIHLADFVGLSKKYVETMVVGDSALYDIRGANTASSILALMNAVSHVLSLPSLVGNQLQLVVVDMRVYTNNTGDLVTAEHAHWTLFHFCKWQNKNNPGRDDDPKHHDIAALLTGRDIYGSHGNGTKGIALTGGACQQKKQCSLVEFLELDAIYATAHEIGHSLGMHHDGHHGNTCPEEGFLMCPYMQDNEAELGWSICSRKYLLNFLNTTGSCLCDEPAINLLPEK